MKIEQNEDEGKRTRMKINAIPMFYPLWKQRFAYSFLYFILYIFPTQQIYALSSSSSTEGRTNSNIFLDENELQSLNINITSLQQSIASGRVYHQKNFLNEEQVQYLISDMERLEKQNAFQRSGLSNTNKGNDQNFGKQDRSTTETPWFHDSILINEDNGTKECKSDTNLILSSIIKRIYHLRYLLSNNLHRPTLISSNLAHECYYSKSTKGAILPRHMDERHEETKGVRGWLLPSRRSISWLIYLSDDNWDININGGALRSFPQKSFEANIDLDQNNKMAFVLNTGSHDGNLQIGWLLSSSSSLSHDNNQAMPVFLDSWYKHVNIQTGEIEPHCVLYVQKLSQSQTIQHGVENVLTSRRVLLTHPFLSDSIVGESVADFIQNRSKLEKKNFKQEISQNLFLEQEYAQNFFLIEDRQLWSLETKNQPPNTFVQDTSPERGSLVMFDSVSVPHEVMTVHRGTRAALAGWFHEETQSFPEGFYDE